MADTAYNNNYKKQQRVSFLNFLAELPNFVAVFVSAVLSGSLIVWMDFIDSLCNVADSGFVTLLSRKLKRDLKYEYNYGIGKIEAISSLCCEGILILGLFIIFASSAHELINPKPPSGLLVYVVLLKLINVAFDAFFLKEQYKIKKTVQARLRMPSSIRRLNALRLTRLHSYRFLYAGYFEDTVHHGIFRRLYV